MAVGIQGGQVRLRPNPVYAFDRPKDENALIRGSLFASVPLFVKSHLGAHRWEEFLGRLDPVAEKVLRGESEVLTWYPFLVISSAVDVIVSMKSDSVDDTLKKLSHHNLDRATNLIFKAIFRMGTPEFMVGKSDQVWKKYYSRGQMLVTSASKGHAVVQLLDFPEMTRNYNKVVLYSIAAVIVKAGGQLQRSEITKDIHRGDDCCEYTYSWR